ncbi:TadE/TadG family type IV pilus assembly protein [Shewanella gaetbuli]
MKPYQAGQSLTEFIIISPLFFLILMGLFEFTYIYRAKTTLNTATFEAARAGALNNAEKQYMQEALIKGLLPLSMAGDQGAMAMSKAYVRTLTSHKIIDSVKNTITIVSPTQAVFNQFKVKRKLTLVNDNKDKERWVIPNDSLLLRGTKTEVIDNGKVLNIQDANLLKIQSFWCYELKVPILRDMLVNALSSGFLGFSSPEQLACNSVARLIPNSKPRIALTSYSVIRMQSHVSDKEFR